MSKRSLYAVIGTRTVGFTGRFRSNDPELTKPGKFGNQIDIKGLTKYFQPIGLGEILKGENQEGNFVVFVEVHCGVKVWPYKIVSELLYTIPDKISLVIRILILYQCMPVSLPTVTSCPKHLKE